MSNETNETPVQGRKVGIARFFELLGRDLWPLYKSGILCVLGFLPGTALAVFGMMAGSALLTAVGGVVGSALLGCIYAYFFGAKMDEVSNPMVACAVACAIAAVISQIGDLAASAIKRNHNVKDYGNLIPGHGGVLDRFDSMIFTAPAIYFALTFLR